ncbi:aldehyde dehydrogenase family protein [Granulosicoccus sp. 3-233]|uniref:aldehyde dehydrogenase family protein n=1 Tax=Granulosicoccus sp. 3-233 TaxID=3417969 RepID=UPI003D3531D3
MDVPSPINGQVLTQVARGTAEDMRSTIASARSAFEDKGWSGQAPAVRRKVLLR